jgi:hypothetical protein
MIDYVLTYDDGDIVGCDCCRSEVPTALFDKPMHLQSEYGRRRLLSEPPKPEDQYRYCEVCATTFIASAHGYPGQHSVDGQVLICMAQCTNMILEAIRKASLPLNPKEPIA